MAYPDHVIDPRKLVAIHIATMGTAFVIGNFAGTTVVSLALGTFILWRADSFQQLIFGFYFSSLGINYMLMLFYAFEINNHESARAEIGEELNKKQGAIAEYRRQTIYLLLPLVVPIVALQRHYKSKPSR
jgi:hypothetical protein